MNHQRAIDLAWAAGLFEGEGCIGLRRKGGGRYPSLCLEMTDEDTVRRFHEVVGVGNVSGPRVCRPETKPTWRWQVASWPEVKQVAAAIRPHLMSRRRARLDEALASRTTVPRPSGEAWQAAWGARKKAAA